MKHEPEIGKLIEGEAHRDAIHIAVAPVTAGGSFHAGERVGFMPDGTVGIRAKELIGIIDPYLSEGVCKGERCYIFLFPKTITSLRHEWTHPAFEASPPQTLPPADKATSEAWLRQYAARVNSYYDAEQAYQTLLDDLRSRELTYHGTDMHGIGDLIDGDLLFHHASIVLGQSINAEQFNGKFYCSC